LLLGREDFILLEKRLWFDSFAYPCNQGCKNEEEILLSLKCGPPFKECNYLFVVGLVVVVAVVGGGVGVVVVTVAVAIVVVLLKQMYHFPN